LTVQSGVQWTVGPLLSPSSQASFGSCWPSPQKGPGPTEVGASLLLPVVGSGSPVVVLAGASVDSPAPLLLLASVSWPPVGRRQAGMRAPPTTSRDSIAL
jgi:hypothetical protein